MSPEFPLRWIEAVSVSVRSPSPGKSQMSPSEPLPSQEETGVLTVSVNGRCSGIGAVAVVSEKKYVSISAAATDEHIGILARQLDRFLSLVILEMDGSALPAEVDRLDPFAALDVDVAVLAVRAQLNPGVTAADEDCRYAFSVVYGDLASGPIRPELDVTARTVELDNDLPSVVEDCDCLWPDLDAVGTSVVSNYHRTGVAVVADENLRTVTIENNRRDSSSSDCTWTRPVNCSAIFPPIINAVRNGN
jgi:hypothetical protein